MKKIFVLLMLALLTLALASCDAILPGATGSTTTEAVTTTAAPAPATSLTVVSCTEVSYVDGVHTYRITFSDGAVADFTVADGAAGLPGTNGTDGAPGTPGANGQPGTPGVSPTVVSCEPIGTAGNETTYRITFSDGATAEFTVKNGADGTPGANGQPGTPGVSPTVVSCEPIGTVGNETTYRITFSDGATAEFAVKNGVDGAPARMAQPRPLSPVRRSARSTT